MAQPRHLLVGGLVAMGFDATGKYLLTVSHSGRGVFATDNWERVARDARLDYPADGSAIGIGPIEGQVIEVVEKDDRRDRIEMQSPDGRHRLVGESDGITITWLPPTKALEPKQDDHHRHGGTKPRQSLSAICECELKGDTLHICHDPAGAKRPAEFKSAAGTRFYLVTYTHKQE